MSLIPGDQLGPYRIVALIGKGGMGEVYRATDTRLNRDVALKVSPKAFDERFAREARAIASLNHPNICTLHDVGPNYLVLELVEGEHPKGPLPIDEALDIANQIANALEAAHEKGIVHRDLKPGNIIIKPDGTVKVLDFGLAKMHVRDQASGEDSPTMSMATTQAGMILGTAAYMAPEQARGKPVDARADIWAFGVVLYELTTGRRLFQGEDVTEIMACVVKEQADLTAAPPRLHKLLKACLRKDPRQRLQAIGDMRLLVDEAAAVATPRKSRLWLSLIGWLAAGLALAFIQFCRPPAPVPVMRLQLPFPDSDTIGFMELSPDGRRLLLTTGGEGDTQIYLRALDSEGMHALSGTRGARSPFWSPDGRSIAFFAGGSLKRISATGGPVQLLCPETDLGRGGTWNRDGVVLLASGDGRLRRVNARGGPCTELGTDDPDFRASLPVFLPDGEHFLYVRQHYREMTGGGLYLATLAEPGGRKVLDDFSSALYAPPAGGRGFAHLLFVREKALMAQPFDSNALETVGDPVFIAPRATLTSMKPQVAASLSADGTLLYLSGDGRDGQFTWMDRSGNVLGKVGPPIAQRGIALSPDGTMLATSRPEHSATSLWHYDLKQGVETRLTPPASPPFSAFFWSPGADQLWFTMIGREGHGLYRKNMRTGELALGQKLDRTGAMVVSDWSRDGRYIVFTRVHPKTRSDIWYLPVDAGQIFGEPVLFRGSDAIESQGQMSPDGKWLAYVSDESGSGQVYVRPFPRGPEVWRVSVDSGREPRWSGNGKELHFLSSSGPRRTALMTAPVVLDGRGALQIGPVRKLFDTRVGGAVAQVNLWTYAPHPDGTRFLVNVPGDTAPPVVNVVTNWQQLVTPSPR